MRSNSVSSDKTDNSNRDDYVELDISRLSVLERILSDDYDLYESHIQDTPNAEGGFIFDGIDIDNTGGSCYGGGKCVLSDDSSQIIFGALDFNELDGSGLTSTESELSRIPSIDSDLARSRFVISGSWSRNVEPVLQDTKKALTATASECDQVTPDEESNFSFGAFVISEDCSVDSDFEKFEDDCFSGLAVYRASIKWIFDVFIPYLQSGKRLEPRSARQVSRAQSRTHSSKQCTFFYVCRF